MTATITRIHPAGPDGQTCHDCPTFLPWDADCFAIDCGHVVCPPCGEERGLGDDYKFGPWAPAS